MEQGGKLEESNRSDLEIKSRKPSDATETKLCCEPVVKLEDGGVASSTPEKASERLTGKSKVEEEIELPERYKSIVELFRQMSCSLRLLALCKKSATFRNVCSQVEILAKRKFSYKHLGQIKYILHEAVQIQKIIIHDEESQCMKPDLKITLVFDVVKDHKQKSDFIALCRLFFSRVVDFTCTHPEGSDIPTVTLPQPFSEDNESASSEVLFPDTSVGLNSGAVGIEPIEQVSIENATDQILNSLHTPLKVTNSSVGSSHACDSPLLYHSSEAGNLMVDTPAQLPPKRASIETVENLLETSNNAVTFSEKPAKRSLDFSFETAERYVLANTEESTEHLTTSQHDIPHSAKSKEHTTDRKDVDGVNICVASGPESKPNYEKTKMSCKIIPSSLHSSVTIIHHIFRSVDYSPITKQELVFKILINSLDIEERGACHIPRKKSFIFNNPIQHSLTDSFFTEVVEVHLEQLESLLPNWISKRISSSGDLMYSIKKFPDVSTLLADLQS